MKAVILGDTHFGGGYALGKIDVNKHINSRLDDFSNTFDYVIDFMVSNSVSHFIITGDIFEHRRPLASELSLFSKKMRKLMELKIHTYIVIGNHDTIREQKTTTVDVLRSLKLPMVHVFSDIETVSCGERDDLINFTFLPFRSRNMLNCSSNEEAVNRLNDQIQYEVNNISNCFPRLLVGHFMIQGTKLGDAVLENTSDEIVLPLSVFNNYAGVIMGHIHNHHIIQDDPLISYIGSMECKDFNEAKVKKYFVLVENNDNDILFNFEALPVRSLFDIEIDQSLISSAEEIGTNIKEYLIKFSKNKPLENSIVRLTIIVNDLTIYSFNKDKIRRFLKEKLKIHQCAGIYPQVISKRQLRKSSITERNSPVESFKSYLELVPDPIVREKMWNIGVNIIKNRGI